MAATRCRKLKLMPLRRSACLLARRSGQEYDSGGSMTATHHSETERAHPSSAKASRFDPRLTAPRPDHPRLFVCAEAQPFIERLLVSRTQPEQLHLFQ